MEGLYEFPICGCWPLLTRYAQGDDNSPASFEKALSTLSGRITKITTRLDNLRQRSRRFTLLWTLYSSFAYLLYSIILILVVGWRSWGIAEYAAILGGPIIIYAVRLGILTYYGYRISKLQKQSDDLEKQRTTTIERLKTATKYNSTQELLKKYGGSPSPKGKTTQSPKQTDAGTPKSGRTNVAPPPTANIPSRVRQISLPSTPQRAAPDLESPSTQNVPHSAAASIPPWEQPLSRQETSAEFAPNAFSRAPEYAQPSEGSRWYDRLVDALLGEDETSPKNRIALICQQCRLVNGQAPPGVKSLDDVGRWRCGGCNTMNGEESTNKLVATIENELAHEKEGSKAKRQVSFATEVDADDQDALSQSHGDHESDVTQYSDESEADREAPKEVLPASAPVAETGTPRRRSTRIKASEKQS
ncbi:MAG: hypothetical protein HETSPECPRED_005467 [Heterodermia speciosa]|uniref:Endoplasmic reticulum junction formation protein lunapark n=1 Tax=Heterodermia speciosa TaxID=116794 RepID=A0A8H3IQT3_9LECA|nr:MAG: hypothetical protein HETSPECPRED_005467 [Heterodermia speciosa]